MPGAGSVVDHKGLGLLGAILADRKLQRLRNVLILLRVLLHRNLDEREES